MYQLQYWHESLAEWRGAGYRSDDREAVARRMWGARQECDDCVTFRVVQELDVPEDTIPF